MRVLISCASDNTQPTRQLEKLSTLDIFGNAGYM